MKQKLIEEATKIVGNFTLNSFEGNSAGVVACALLADNDKIYTGINLNFNCSLGFCAEASAISLMLKDRVTKIKQIVAITDQGNIIPPCGRCRELIYQVDTNNLETQVIISDTQTLPLKDLLPHTWIEAFNK